MSTFDEIEQTLFDATAAVPEHYFELPVAGRDGAIFRERAYCYELYHQWRMRWRDDLGLTIGCEIDKKGHPIIVDCADKPDFLVHEPGSMENNALIIEVKTARASNRKLAEDLIKLCRFRSPPANYQHAIFLMFGIGQEAWTARRNRVLRAIRTHEAIDPELFRVLLHEAPGERARYATW